MTALPTGALSQQRWQRTLDRVKHRRALGNGELRPACQPEIPRRLRTSVSLCPDNHWLALFIILAAGRMVTQPAPVHRSINYRGSRAEANALFVSMWLRVSTTAEVSDIAQMSARYCSGREHRCFESKLSMRLQDRTRNRPSWRR